MNTERIKIISGIFMMTLILIGCSSREAVREEASARHAEAMNEYEKSFDTAEHNTPFKLKEESKPQQTADMFVFPDTEPPGEQEYAQGFRIQLYSTTDMEAAQEVYMVADSLFSDQWIYIVFEVPFYKVRLGDFQTRPDANKSLARISRLGFREAWIVPDRVIKDPPEKIIETDLPDMNQR